MNALLINIYLFFLLFFVHLFKNCRSSRNMPDRLMLTKNTQFYLHNNNITDQVIQNILDSATENMTIGTNFEIDLFRQNRVTESEIPYIFSLKVFSSSRPVYFLDDNLQDQIYAFILIIEYDNYLTVFKKSCANISEELEEHFTLISSDSLFGMVDENSTNLQKISLRNMTISEKAIRTRSYEALDLKGLLSTHSAGRAIPFYLKIRQGSLVKTISSTGHLIESSERKSLDEIVDWVKVQIDLINNPLNNSFLNSFAKKVKLGEVLDTCRAHAILIESSSLCEKIISSGLPLIYKNTNGQDIPLSSKLQNKLFSKLEEIYEFDEQGNVIGRESCTRIRINSKTLTFKSKILSKIKVIENGKPLTLQRFIIKNGLYSITFTDPKYMYFMGATFEDASGIAEIDSILDIFSPKPEIAIVNSEKGNFSKNQKAFESTSMFHAVEQIHKNDDYIFCDDLGNEWADHITINKNDSCINFVHSKHGKTSKSASQLQDVVGQGIKNLGYLYFTQQEILDKVKKTFSQKYRNDGVLTKINRVRKGNVANLSKDVQILLKDFKLHRKCILSCSFLSKQEITNEFTKIKNGQAVKGNITQLLWILSSFAHAVRDANAIPIIYCKN